LGKAMDVYINVIGGTSAADESSRNTAVAALDLAAAMALVSSHLSIPVRGDTVFLAQVGLLGELRSLSNMELRLEQASRYGFSRVVMAKRKEKLSRKFGLECHECSNLRDALDVGLSASIPKFGGTTKKKAGGSSKRKQQEEDKVYILDDEEDEYDDSSSYQ